MTVEQFLQSLSYLMWASYWSVIFYKFFKNNKNNKEWGGGVMERPERYPSGYFIPELIEDEDIIFNKDSDYQKQKKKEKKNPIFKRNKFKNR